MYLPVGLWWYKDNAGITRTIRSLYPPASPLLLPCFRAHARLTFSLEHTTIKSLGVWLVSQLARFTALLHSHSAPRRYFTGCPSLGIGPSLDLCWTTSEDIPDFESRISKTTPYPYADISVSLKSISLDTGDLSSCSFQKSRDSRF